MIERQIEVTTPEGEMTTFVFHPEHGGPHPVVLYLMDAPSIRPALKDMASRLATAGYYVMLPYLFYRGGPFREFGTSDEDMHARQELMGTVTPTNIVTDAEALLAVADDDPAAARRQDRRRRVLHERRPGDRRSPGRCPSASPRRRRSTAPGWCATATTRRTVGLDPVQAELYFAWCDDDPTAPTSDMPIMEDAMKAAGVDVHDRLPHRRRARLRARPARATTGRRRSCTGSASTPCSAPQPLTVSARPASSATATPFRRL